MYDSGYQYGQDGEWLGELLALPVDPRYHEPVSPSLILSALSKQQRALNLFHAWQVTAVQFDHQYEAIWAGWLLLAAVTVAHSSYGLAATCLKRRCAPALPIIPFQSDSGSRSLVSGLQMSPSSADPQHPGCSALRDFIFLTFAILLST